MRPSLIKTTSFPPGNAPQPCFIQDTSKEAMSIFGKLANETQTFPPQNINRSWMQGRHRGCKKPHPLQSHWFLSPPLSSSERQKVHPDPQNLQAYQVWALWLHQREDIPRQVLRSVHRRAVLHPTQNHHPSRGLQVSWWGGHEEEHDVHQDLCLPLQLPRRQWHLRVTVLQEDVRRHGLKPETVRHLDILGRHLNRFTSHFCVHMISVARVI